MVREGDSYHDPVVDKTFTVVEGVDTFGKSTAELDQEQVQVQYEDGETVWKPYDQFSGHCVFEFLGHTSL
jgi:hypothetical protein